MGLRQSAGLIGRLVVAVLLLLTVVVASGSTSAAAAGNKLDTPIVTVPPSATVRDIVAFDWGDVSGARNYRIRITLNGHTIVRSVVWNSQINYTLNYSGTYCAYVTARPAHSTDSESNVSTQACVTASPRVLETPTFQEATTEKTRLDVRFGRRLIWWSQVGGASEYLLEVTKNGSAWHSTTKNVAYSRINLSRTGVYCFTVTALSSDPAFDASPKSDEHCMTVFERLPSSVIYVNGLHQKAVGESMRFSWDEVPNAGYHEVTIVRYGGTLIERPRVTNNWIDYSFNSPGRYCVIMVSFPADPNGLFGYSDDSNTRCVTVD